MSERASDVLWTAGWPARALLIGLIRAYRLSLSGLVGGRCRFYPSCSAYAEAAIHEAGAVRGSALAVWRVLRCTPLSKGGIDHPPVRARRPMGVGSPAIGAYDVHIRHRRQETAVAGGAEGAA